MPRLRIALAVVMLAMTGAGATPGFAEPAKLATDAPVRAGMLAIRDLVRLNHSLITHRRMPLDHAQRFAKAIGAQADTMLATSKISGAAKERLAALLAEVTTGVEAVAHPERGVAPVDGLVRVDEALARYPREFDHPGWAPVQSLD